MSQKPIGRTMAARRVGRKFGDEPHSDAKNPQAAGRDAGLSHVNTCICRRDELPEAKAYLTTKVREPWPPFVPPDSARADE